MTHRNTIGVGLIAFFCLQLGCRSAAPMDQTAAKLEFQQKSTADKIELIKNAPIPYEERQKRIEALTAQK